MEFAQKQPPDPGKAPEYNAAQEQRSPHGREGRQRGEGVSGQRRYGGRLTAYFIVAGVCNVFLALYALYAFGSYTAFSDELLASGQSATLAETVYGLALLASPLILSVLINRLLFCAMRGRRRRFPRFAGLGACLLILLVQAVVILLVIYTSAATADGFGVDTIARLLS